MTTDELRELLIGAINRNIGFLNASPIEAEGAKAVIGIEHEGSGELFFVEITEA